MNYLKRGFTSIVRQPIKSLILLGLIFILGNIIAGAISVQKAVKSTESIIRAKMTPVVTLEYDEEIGSVLQEQNPEFLRESLSVETIEKIGTLPYVKSFDYSVGTTFESRVLERSGRNLYGAAWFNAFAFQGVNDPDLIDLKEDKIKLISGRVFNEQEITNISYVALISQSVANINNISVGSKVDFEINLLYGDADGNSQLINFQHYEFEVIGIFEPVKQVRTGGYGYDDLSWMDDDMENKIYAPNKVLYEVNTARYNEYVNLTGMDFRELKEYTPLYILKDPMDMDRFIEDSVTLMPDYYKVINFAEDFNKVAAPLKSIQDITAIVLYIAIAATIIILGLLTTLFLRDRRHEMGIYLAMGERKIKIAMQIGLEVIIVAVIAITLSLLSGNILSRAVSENMLIDQIAAEQVQTEEFSWSKIELETRGYQFEISSDDIVQSYEVSLDLMTILLFYAVGIGTIWISALIPILYAIRLSPKRILM